MDKELTKEEIKELLEKSPNLSLQSFDTLKGEISPLTFEIMSRQATINVGKISLIKKRYNWSRRPWKNNISKSNFRYPYN